MRGNDTNTTAAITSLVENFGLDRVLFLVKEAAHDIDMLKKIKQENEADTASVAAMSPETCKLFLSLLERHGEENLQDLLEDRLAE
jgi:hypothetical protein